MGKIRIGILGYGNLGRGVELAIRQNPDMELAAIFTRRNPSSVKPVTPGAWVFPVSDVEKHTGEVDVMILCGGSATDLPEQGPRYSRLFHTVDSFDTHAKIPEYFSRMDQSAGESGHVSLLSVGWDPGLFSISRLFGAAVLPQGKNYTFWGRGVSQGHSDAIRRIEGVADAKQYTVPVEEALEQVRQGVQPELSPRQMHTRECYVVAEEGADKAEIQRQIQEMPNYFSDYDTTVHFISQAELDRDHHAMPHGGFVLRSGITAADTPQLMEYSLKLGSNPEFTSSVLICYARAAWRLAQEGRKGAMTVLDVPPAYLSAQSGEELRKTLL